MYVDSNISVWGSVILSRYALLPHQPSSHYTAPSYAHLVNSCHAEYAAITTRINPTGGCCRSHKPCMHTCSPRREVFQRPRWNGVFKRLSATLRRSDAIYVVTQANIMPCLVFIAGHFLFLSLLCITFLLRLRLLI